MVGFVLGICAVVATVGVVRDHPNFIMDRATIHAMSRDAGVTVLLVSGEARFAAAGSERRVVLDRTAIIHRRNPNRPRANPNAAKRNFTAFSSAMTSKRSIDIACLGAELLRDSDGELQAVSCRDLGTLNRGTR